MNYQRRKVRPRQPAIPSAPATGTQKAGMGSSMSAKGTVGTGSPSGNACKGTVGGGMKSY